MTTPADKFDKYLQGDLLFESSITAMMLVDDTRTIVKTNKRFCDLFGYTNDEILGHPTSILTPTMNHFEAYKQYFERTRDGSYASNELQYKKKHGELFWVKLTGIPITVESKHFVFWSFDDITREVKARQELKDRYQELEIIFNKVPTGLIFIVDGFIDRINSHFLDMVGQKRHDLMGKKISSLLCDFEEEKNGGKKKLVQFHNRNKAITVEREIVAVSETSHIIIFLDVTTHVKEKKALTTLAETDGLTATFNRNTFIKKTQKMINDPAHEYVSLLMLDIDDFKRINDNYGHDIGDDVLIELAELLKSSLRSMEILGRMGGEEFAIAFPISKKKVLPIGKRLVYAICNEKFTSEKLNITVSMGLTDTSFSTLFEMLYKEADRLMYLAKRSGKNQLLHSGIAQQNRDEQL